MMFRHTSLRVGDWRALLRRAPKSTRGACRAKVRLSAATTRDRLLDARQHGVLRGKYDPVRRAATTGDASIAPRINMVDRAWSLVFERHTL